LADDRGFDFLSEVRRGIGHWYAERHATDRDYPGPDAAVEITITPPLLVKCHGGPTSAASSTLNLGIQYWTSRGIAVLDVNYGGSSGFGRAHRDRLQAS
jgi:dipeptidyl aminopeptidase/acylaminoacyl peptidase